MKKNKARMLRLIGVSFLISFFITFSFSSAQNVKVVGQDTGDYYYTVALQGNYAYVVDGFEVKIIDISNPSLPTQVGYYTMLAAGNIAVRGNYAYDADWNSGLQIINISNPALPTLAGAYTTGSNVVGVALNGNYAYVAGGNLDIINRDCVVMSMRKSV